MNATPPDTWRPSRLAVLFGHSRPWSAQLVDDQLHITGLDPTHLRAATITKVKTSRARWMSTTISVTSTAGESGCLQYGG